MIAGASDQGGPGLTRRALPLLVALALSLAACGGDDEPELTFEDRLVELEGRPLTPLDVARQAEIGRSLCLLDDRILDEMWQQLSDDQLEFQDIVIVSFCPERAVLYAGHTGRFVTEEAEESGVRTSTTRPTSTTTSTTRSTTTRPQTTSTAGAGTSAPGETGSSATPATSPSPSSVPSSAPSSTTSRPTTSPTTATLRSTSTST